MDNINKINSLDESEFKIIEILNENDHITQRYIAKRAGISLGLTNVIIKRLIKKGFIKIKTMNRKKILYNLTPKAIIEKSFRTYNYFEKTVKDVIRIREKIQNAILFKQPFAYEQVLIIGNNEVSEIVRWAIQELKLNCDIIRLHSADGEKRDAHTLVINCEKDIIDKQNYINVYKIL